jgi:hypothetical protein
MRVTPSSELQARLQRPTGLALILTALAVVLGALLGDPTIESRDDLEKFVEQVESAADRIPVVYVGQAVEVASAFLTLAAGVGLYAAAPSPNAANAVRKYPKWTTERTRMSSSTSSLPVPIPGSPSPV